MSHLLARSLPWTCPSRTTRMLQRGISSTNTKKSESTPAEPVPKPDANGFYSIYRFNYIVQASSICRFKIYHTGLTLGVISPWIVYQHYVDQTVDLLGMQAVLALSFGSLGALLGAGELFRRCVGILYYHPEEDLVKIAHLTFFGRRRDIVIPRLDVMPISDTPEDPKAPVWRVHFLDESQKKLLISTRFGTINHQEYFEKIFGRM